VFSRRLSIPSWTRVRPPWPWSGRGSSDSCWGRTSRSHRRWSPPLPRCSSRPSDSRTNRSFCITDNSKPSFAQVGSPILQTKLYSLFITLSGSGSDVHYLHHTKMSDWLIDWQIIDKFPPFPLSSHSFIWGITPWITPPPLLFIFLPSLLSLPHLPQPSNFSTLGSSHSFPHSTLPLSFPFLSSYLPFSFSLNWVGGVWEYCRFCSDFVMLRCSKIWLKMDSCCIFK